MTTDQTAQPLDLDAIRARANEAKAAADVTRFAGQADLVVHGLRAAASVADVPALLAEVDRLRAEPAALAAADVTRHPTGCGCTSCDDIRQSVTA